MSRLPRLPVWVLRAAAPPGERDYVVGDLEEAFRRREARSGRARALGWIWVEALRSLGPLMTYPRRWEGMTVTGWTQDLRGAVRVVRTAPGFAAVVVLTLGIGVGAASAVYSVVRGVLLTPLDFEEPERVVMLWGQSPEYARTPLTVGDHNVLVHDVDAFEVVAGAWSNRDLILGGAAAEQVSVGWVTPEYFDLLGIAPAVGRRLAPTDESGVMISHDLWVRRYGADPSVVGELMDLGGRLFEIVGVVPAYQDPNLSSFGGTKTEHHIWRLQPASWTEGDDRSVGWIRSSARLRDGVTLAQAQAEVDALFERVNATVTDRDGGSELRVHLIPVKVDLVGDVSRTLWILLAAVVGVLLIAASNVAHLSLARGEARASEMSVRLALGGSRSRLVRQLLVEGGVLAGVGGLLGIALAYLGVPALLSLAPDDFPRLEAVQLDWSVVAFALAATGGCALLFALVPALRSTKADLTDTLGQRSVSGDPRSQRLSRALVVAEVAVSLVLVTSTGLLLKSMAGLSAVDLGFEPSGLVTFSLEAPEWGDTDEEAAATIVAFSERFASVPGVRSVGFTNRLPLGGGLYTGYMRSAEMVAADASPLAAAVRFVTPGYLDAMGGRLVAGRWLRTDDGTQHVVVDELIAERFWPGRNPVGQTLETNAVGQNAAVAEVVGVVEPMKHHGVAESATETVFFSMLAQARQHNFRYVAARVQGSPVASVDGLRAAARQVDSNAVVSRVRTMDDLFADDVATTRFSALLLALFGGIALLLASVGLHGVMAYSMRRRTREIGIRVVLGARHGEIVGDAVRSGGWLVLAGVAIGLVTSLGAARLLESLLFEVSPLEPSVLLGGAAVMGAFGLLGAYLPARLALSVDPAVTLREE